MKMFTKLALVSSMAISANAMAMQAMDDAALSSATGQDGLSIGIGITQVSIDKLMIHDNDGYTSPTAATAVGDLGFGGTATAGTIVVNDVVIGAPTTDGLALAATGANLDTSRILASGNLADLVIDTDAGTAANGGAFLNIAAEVSGLDIKLGAIEIAAANGGNAGTSGTVAGTIQRGTAGTANQILSGLTIKTGQMDANIQLGATPQGAMIMLDSTMLGGLEITDLGIKDAGAGGEIFVDSIKVADSAGEDLTLQASVGVKTTGLAITAMKTASDLYVSGVHLGTSTAASIGDVEVQGMQVSHHAAGGSFLAPGAQITISGH